MVDILGPLLTGGILIGKICQSLTQGAATKVYRDEKTGVKIIGEVSSGGVTFFRREGADGSSQVYAFNRSTSLPATVVVPNGAAGDGVTYYLKATEKFPFPEASSELVPPTTSVMTGAVTVASDADVGGGKDALFKLAFSGLTTSAGVNVGSFKLTCTTGQLLLATVGITVNAMTYMSLNSNKGVVATSTTAIPAEPVNNANNVDGELTFAFTIDFEDLGIEPETDAFGGIMSFTSPDTTLPRMLALSKIAASKLDEVEKAYFGLS